MELPQSRSFATEGRKATHDFLSLNSPVQQDPRPQPGGYLHTHDFLQPLERDAKYVPKEENTVEINGIGKAPSPAPPSVEHLLPGGIGTYSICYVNQRSSRPEGSLFPVQASSTTRNDENSNCSSYSGSGFTLWDEIAIKKGKTGKENNVTETQVLRETGISVVGGQWATDLDPLSHSTSNHKHNPTTFSSLSSSLPSSSQKHHSFMKMITSAKNDDEEEEDDDDEEFVIKKEQASHLKSDFSVKVEGKPSDQKPSTPRSKHSATEQRRRSKINDRFLKLREIIPHSDQKRDKASFLLEVIEYIQFLQEKVHKFETSYDVWNPESSKLMEVKSRQMPEGFIDYSQGMNSGLVPASAFAVKLGENKTGASSAIPVNGQNTAEPDISTYTKLRERNHLPEFKNKAVPVLSTTTQQSSFPFGRSSIFTSSVLPVQESDADKTTSWPQPQCPGSRVPAADMTSYKLKEQELTIESGSISISSVYSQGLLKSLTKALKSSGVDLSQASISVQIDLGKRANLLLGSSVSTVKDDDAAGGDQSLSTSRVAIAGEDQPSQFFKRQKTS